MLRQRLYSSKYSFFDKLKSIDYFLIFLILILAAISFMVMYSTDGGKIAYHTKNHFIRFCWNLIRLWKNKYINKKAKINYSSWKKIFI